MPLLIPPLPEQQKIAEILFTWDRAIEAAEKLLANAQTQRRELMRQLLTGKRRLKAHSHRRWSEVKLGSLFHERVERGQDGLQLLSITGAQGVVSQDETDMRDTSKEDKSAYKRIAVGDIGYNTMRMWQGVSALSSMEGLISPAYTVLIPRLQIDGKFASFLFKLPAQIHKFLRYSQGLTSDQWNLKFKHFKEVPARVPVDVAEQRAIANVLSEATLSEQELKDAIAKLLLEKRALMQQLLTGKRRVAP